MSQSTRISSRSLDVLEWEKIQMHLSERSRSAAGRDLALNLVPGTLHWNQAQLRSAAAVELHQMYKEETEYVLPLGEIPEIKDVLKRISRSGTIVVEEFANLVRFHRAAQGLNAYMHRHGLQSQALLAALRGIDSLEAWARRHFPLLDPRGEIADTASTDLRALRTFSKDLHERIRNKLNDFLTDPKKLDLLQEISRAECRELFTMFRILKRLCLSSLKKWSRPTTNSKSRSVKFKLKSSVFWQRWLRRLGPA
jgi:dsDNA-specific endonuclease/ATPase MutS2